MILFTTIFTCLDSAVFSNTRIVYLLSADSTFSEVKNTMQQLPHTYTLSLPSPPYFSHIFLLSYMDRKYLNKPNKYGNAWHSSYQRWKEYKNKTRNDLLAHIGVKCTGLRGLPKWSFVLSSTNIKLELPTEVSWQVWSDSSLALQGYFMDNYINFNLNDAQWF